jgi:CTP:molybdopterin cytidylyltransferase MocA
MKSRKEGKGLSGPPAGVAGVILAAGESSRMGQRKAFLRHEGTGATCLSHLVGQAIAAGLSPVLGVGRDADPELEQAVRQAGARYVPNPAAAHGQLTSILAGLDSLGGEIGAAVVMPVDVPMVSASTIRRVVEAAGADRTCIARATYRGRHGHPVLFARAVFDELRAADPAVGARAVVRADPSRVRDVEVDEPGVTIDIDTPEDYFRAFGSRL